MSLNRLPGWVRRSKIRIGWINHSTLIAVFEDSIQEDKYDICGFVGADTVVLLNTENYAPNGASLRAPSTGGPITLFGEYRDQRRVRFNLITEYPAFFDCGFAGYHVPIALLNVFFLYSPFGKDENPIMTSFIPFAIYIHRDDINSLQVFQQFIGQNILKSLTDIHNSEIGSFYEALSGRVHSFDLNKKSGVIVLGKDSGSDLQELLQVRDYLRGKGYNAELIKELPEIPMMSNEEKVRLWTLSSRFCVMVDRIPAGHLAEYQILKSQRSILALLRPVGVGSTYMIGDDELIDLNFIKTFNFEQTPLDMLEDVIDWAEKFVSDRTRSYENTYPWRNKN
ncbi:MAG: hypothetical protein PHF80_08625 [Methanothrix sp.]|nr:hypothetical protein [Methanothrix sp.]